MDFDVTYDAFKKVVSQFLRDTSSPNSYTEVQLDAGIKCINLLWLNRDDTWNDFQILNSIAMLEMVSNQQVEMTCNDL